MGRVSPLVVAWACAALALGCSSSPRPQAPASFNAQTCVERSLRRVTDPAMLPLAFSEFTKACDAGEASACSSLGVMYELGLATGEDHARAAKLYRFACGKQNIGGCTNLGLAYLHGIGIPSDALRAKELLAWSCTHEHPLGCRELGTMHLIGEGVDVEPETAAKYFRLGCRKGDGEACYNVGFLYDQGTSVRQDVAQALSYYEQACIQGEPRGCDGITAIQKASDRAAKARDEVKPLPSEAECDAGNGSACASAGMAYFRGEPVKRDVDRAVRFMQRACAAGHDSSCNVLGPMLQGSCAKGHGDSCVALQKLDAASANR